MKDEEIIKILEESKEITKDTSSDDKWLVHNIDKVLEIEELKKWYYNAMLKPIHQKLKKYKGENSFLLSLQKYLRNTKNHIVVNNRNYKCLSEKQYKVVKDLL